MRPLRNHRLRRRALGATAALALCAAGGASFAAVSGSENLVAASNGGQILKLTSQFDDHRWAARNLIDGLSSEYVLERGRIIAATHHETSYGWMSSTAAFPQEIILAFRGETTKIINKVVLDPRTADPPDIGRWARSVDVYTSRTTRDGPYQLAGSFLVLNVPRAQAFEFPATQARYVKLRVNSNWGSDRAVELGEFAVYEAIVREVGLDGTIRRATDLLGDLRRFRGLTADKLAASGLDVTASEASGPGGGPKPLNVVAAANGGTLLSYTGQFDNGRWAARNLIDGLTTEYVIRDGRVAEVKENGASAGWMSDKLKFPQEFVLAFKDQEPRIINKLVIDPRTPDPPEIGRWAQNVEVYTSNTRPDAGYDLAGSYVVLNMPRPQSFTFPPVEARYVKLRINSNWGSNKAVELGEIAVYQATVGANELDQLVVRLETLIAELTRLRDEGEARPAGGGASPSEGAPGAAGGEGGQRMVPVPAVMLTSLEKAEAALKEQGLVVGAVTREHSDTADVGIVIGQTPKAGSTVLEGSKVDLVVSDGPAAKLGDENPGGGP